MFTDIFDKPFKNLSVKVRLSIAFSCLALVSLLIAYFALRGFNQTGAALKSLEEDSVPEISIALDIANQSSQLAAFAPFLGSLQVKNRVETESTRLQKMMTAFQIRLDEIKTSPSQLISASDINDLSDMAELLSLNLNRLIITTRDRLDVRSDALEIDYALSKRSDIFQLLSESAQFDNSESAQFDNNANEDLVDLQQLTEIIFRIRTAENPVILDRLEAQYNEKANSLLDALRLQDFFGRQRVIELIETQAKVFDLRRRELDLEQRTRFLLSSINALSNKMSALVSNRVALVIDDVQSRSKDTVEDLNASRFTILALLAFGVGTAAFVITFMLRALTNNLQDIALGMSRLAEGDHDVKVSGSGRSDEIGSLARAFGVFKDRSIQNMRLSQEIAENAKTLEVMFEHMTDGLSVFDKQGHLVSWNPQFLDMHKIEPQHITKDMTFSSLISLLTDSGMQAQKIDGSKLNPFDHLEVRRKVSLRYEHKFPDGRVIELRSRPIPDSGFVTTYTDLTENRKLERQVRATQRMEAVGQLTGGIAHDFNNLLSVITGNLQLLQQDLGPHPLLADRALRALDASERGAILTQRLLAFSSQQALKPEITNLNELIISLHELLTYSFDSKVSLQHNLAENLPDIFVDVGQLENSVVNLIFNGRDAIKDKGTVSITTQRSNNGVEIIIKDDGCGMDEDILARIYEPFFTTKRKGQGTGLGLSMVYGFVKQTGGKLDVQSKLGVGTQVTISLPEATQEERKLKERPLRLPESPGKGERILLVEDDPTVNKTALDILQDLGYLVTSVNSYEDAKTVLSRKKFDLLFTDVMLPSGFTGLDIASYAREKYPDIGVLFTSGFGREEVMKTISQWPDAELLLKPYRRQNLSASLRSQLRRNTC